MATMAKALSFALPLAIFLACSGSTVGSATPQQACSDFANVYCARVNDCAPTYLRIEYGDVSTCESRLQVNCPLGFQAPGTGLTPAISEKCIGAIPQVSCADLFARNLPQDCAPVAGSLQNGSACADDNQCTGKYCNLGSNQVCGACSTKAAAGAACGVDNDCGPGMACWQYNCTEYVPSGGACGPHRAPCNPTLNCKGTCAAPDGVGATCIIGGSDGTNTTGCDPLHGVFCNDSTGKCQQVSTATAGQPCGLVNGSPTICTGGATCFGVYPNTTCTAAAADGASCDVYKGIHCQSPALCISGVCKLKDPTSCK
jgi:hypothetical protein